MISDDRVAVSYGVDISSTYFYFQIFRMDQIQMQAWTAGALESLQEKTDLLEGEISRAVQQCQQFSNVRFLLYFLGGSLHFEYFKFFQESEEYY